MQGWNVMRVAWPNRSELNEGEDAVFLVTLIFSVNIVLLIVVGAILVLIAANEVVLRIRASKKASSGRSAAAPKPERQKKAKKVKKHAHEELAQVCAFETSTASDAVENYEPMYLADDEEEQAISRLSGKVRYVEEVESMRVGLVTTESVRNGRAISDAWTPRNPVDDYVAGDISGYHSEAGRQSLASQLRAAHDSFEFDEVDDGSLRILNQDSSVRIVDTRIDSAAFRRRA